MMIAMDRGRGFGARDRPGRPGGDRDAGPRGRSKAPVSQTRSPRRPPAAAPTPQRRAAPSRYSEGHVRHCNCRAIPVNPTDPIAIVNGQAITRQQLADECVARKGEEILETLIARELIEQALRGKKLRSPPPRSTGDRNVAQRFGIGREGWLRTLAKERGISPIQYARDIIYPALALRKLGAAPGPGHRQGHAEILRGPVRREAPRAG